MKTPKVTRTLLDTAPPLSNAELVDAQLDQLKLQDEALFAAVVARMEKDEDFRRRVHAEAERLGVGRRGAKAQNPALVRSIVHNFRLGGGDKKETVEALMKTLGLSAKQAGRLYDEALASSTTTRIHRIRR